MQCCVTVLFLDLGDILLNNVNSAIKYCTVIAKLVELLFYVFIIIRYALQSAINVDGRIEYFDKFNSVLAIHRNRPTYTSALRDVFNSSCNKIKR